MKEVQHFLLHRVHLPRDDERVQRGAKVGRQELLHGARKNALAVGPNASYPDSFGLRGVHSALPIGFYLKQLLDARVDAHIPRRFVQGLAADHRLHVGLLDADVEQAECVKPLFISDRLVVNLRKMIIVDASAYFCPGGGYA